MRKQRHQYPRWVRELAEAGRYAAVHAQTGQGMVATAEIGRRVRAAAREHGWELGRIVRALADLEAERTQGRA